MLKFEIKRGYQKRSKKVEQLEKECEKGLTGEVTTEKLDKVIDILAEIEQLTAQIHKDIYQKKKGG